MCQKSTWVPAEMPDFSLSLSGISTISLVTSLAKLRRGNERRSGAANGSAVFVIKMGILSLLFGGASEETLSSTYVTTSKEENSMSSYHHLGTFLAPCYYPYLFIRL